MRLEALGSSACNFNISSEDSAHMWEGQASFCPDAKLQADRSGLIRTPGIKDGFGITRFTKHDRSEEELVNALEPKEESGRHGTEYVKHGCGLVLHKFHLENPGRGPKTGVAKLCGRFIFGTTSGHLRGSFFF